MTETMRHSPSGTTIWSLARRLGACLALPGGPGMTDQALRAVGLGRRARVVELAPGIGIASARAWAREPGAWTGVEPDPLAAEHLVRGARGPGRRVVSAPVEATRLEDGSASVVLADALLSTLPRDARAAVLAEAARLLPAGGRLAIHEIALAPGVADGGEALGDLAAAGLHAPSVEGWRAEAQQAGLVPVGALPGPLRLPAPRDLMRQAGPRTALRVTRELARDASARGGAAAAREALSRRVTALRAVVLVAEKPLVMGIRRPRA